ncbi:hypothetical protein [Pseudoalteromonas denitrificans]|uniref:Uncharacterized protein n=1 Tax=Pseudoalteromonas denitrificans DSM 6059 TaxID=1123010 RepID=A0A1I1G7Q2_9GAMM|nr:hypothetical protein [Pseudoalteromonas denitrificans]SFC07565.1 hypothetical protein SAMN02745724_00847 [Pseudoalteromonas denitrificans DSM 6059]
MKNIKSAFKFKGMVHSDNQFHHPLNEQIESIAPSYITVPGGKHIAQYAPTVQGESIDYDPAKNCQGSFMSYKFQVHNNCYNYSCNVATNSFAQPGRKHGLFLGAPTGEWVVDGARQDGLEYVGNCLSQVRDHASNAPEGHYVALLISPADQSVGWPGDYHWVRCDDNVSLNTWSQKDGGDQVTNFDFAGNAIVNPQEANWVVNQGPMKQDDPNDIIVTYDFYGYLFVPKGKIDII